MIRMTEEQRAEFLRSTSMDIALMRTRFDEIDEQKRKLNERFINNPKAVFIDTTEGTVDECVNKMLKECNAIMRKRRKW